MWQLISTEILILKTHLCTLLKTYNFIKKVLYQKRTGEIKNVQVRDVKREMGVTNFDRCPWPNRGWNLTTLIFKCSKANIRSRIGNIAKNFKPVIIEKSLHFKNIYIPDFTAPPSDQDEISGIPMDILYTRKSPFSVFPSLYIWMKSHNIWSDPIFTDDKFLILYI